MPGRVLQGFADTALQRGYTPPSPESWRRLDAYATKVLSDAPLVLGPEEVFTMLYGDSDPLWQEFTSVRLPRDPDRRWLLASDDELIELEHRLMWDDEEARRLRCVEYRLPDGEWQALDHVVTGCEPRRNRPSWTR